MAAAISPRVRVNATQLKTAFAKFSAVEKKQIMETTLRNDVKGFVRDVIAITPPGHKENKIVSGSKGEAAVKAARSSIRTDLIGGKRGGGAYRGGVFTVLDDKWITAALANEPNPRGYRRLFTKRDGTVYGTEETMFKPFASIGEMYDHHHRYYKNGRMSSAGGKTRDVGRWKFIDRMVVSREAFERYFEYVCEKIGILAGGWGAAAKEFKVTMPKIARRHSTGQCSPPQIRDDHWSVRIENTVGYATEADMNRRIDFALDSRKRSARIANSIKHQIIAKLKQRGVTA